MRKWPFAGVIVLLVVVSDQLTKILIRDAIPLHETVVMIPSLFNLTYVTNPGGAFNLLARSDESFRIPFFLCMTAVAVGALLYFLRDIRTNQKVLIFAVAGVLGGAIGNFIDRVTMGEVTDFLDFYWGSYHWPSFNVADSFISVGVFVLVIHSLFDREDRAEE